MRIREAMERSGLTRKALHYYEGIGLISPSVLENGYRDYSAGDVERLRLIAALRSVEMPLDMVRQAIGHPEALGELLHTHRRSLSERQRELDGMAARADEMMRLAQSGKPITGDLRLETVGERLRLAFPGGFGQMLEAHFQPFLAEPVETARQREALEEIICFLDGLELDLPEVAAPGEPHGEVQQAYWREVDRLLALPEEERLAQLRAMRERKREMDAVLAGQAPDVLADLQRKGQRAKELLQTAGYYEHVVANLRRISPRYDRYLAELERLGRLLGD